MPADLVIRNARIIDGSGGPAVEGDVAVTDGRISAVSTGGGGGSSSLDAGAGTVEIDAAGAVLSPGFVDTHTHDDGALIIHPDLAFKVAQGCTSLVIGNCGFSAIPSLKGDAARGLLGGVTGDWTGLDGFRQAVEAVRPAANAMSLIGHNSMRQAVMGDSQEAPTATELATMRGFVEAAMDEGACGFSTGLIYRPGRYSTTEEVISLAEPAGAAGGLYATHMRDERHRLLEAVEEAIRVGRETGCGVHISHHKAAGKPNWGLVNDSLALVDRTNTAGEVDVTLDVYPYTAGSGRMIEYFNLDNISVELAEVIRLASCPAFPEYEGKMLVDIAAAENIALDELVRRILTAPKGERTICIHFIIDEADIETNLRHPLMMVGSDGIPDLKGRPHPRLYGTFPRVLAHYVRDRHVLTLEEAVRRMTSLSCDRFGLVNRGRIEEGYWADLVVFDPDRVQDTATYDDPKQEPLGIDWVVVNGQVAVDHGRHTGAGAGRLLHYNRDEAA